MSFSTLLLATLLTTTPANTAMPGAENATVTARDKRVCAAGTINDWAWKIGSSNKLTVQNTALPLTWQYQDGRTVETEGFSLALTFAEDEGGAQKLSARSVEVKPPAGPLASDAKETFFAKAPDMDSLTAGDEESTTAPTAIDHAYLVILAEPSETAPFMQSAPLNWSSTEADKTVAGSKQLSAGEDPDAVLSRWKSLEGVRVGLAVQGDDGWALGPSTLVSETTDFRTALSAALSAYASGISPGDDC